MSSSPKQSAQHFLVLDGLRGLAALAIAFRHAPFLWAQGHPEGVLRESYLAVDFFFALSGFVLVHAYGARLREGMSFLGFMALRLVRLYPLFLLAIALAFLANRIGAATDPMFPKNYVQFLFLPSPGTQGSLYPWNYPAWSLFMELLANGALAIIFLRRWTLLVPLIVGGGALAILLCVPMGLLGFGANPGPMDAGANWPEFGAGLIRIGYAFFAGALIYALHRARPALVRMPPAVTMAALLAALLAWPTGTVALWFDMAVTLLLFPAIVYLGASCDAQGMLSRLLKKLGDLSYGIYILQVPIYHFVRRGIGAALPGDVVAASSLTLGILSVLIVVLVTWIAELAFDLPLRRLLRRAIPRSWLA